MDTRYQTLEKIGQGGAGTVFRAWDSHLGREVALKRIAIAQNEIVQEEAIASLRREVAALSTLNHPNVVSLLDVGQDQAGAYVVMEYLNGEDLHNIGARSLLTEKDFRRLAGQLLDGLAAAHSQGVLHLDIKPANVRLLWPRGSQQFVAKLVDFGLARPAGQSLFGAGEKLWGSIHFMAPELFDGTPPTAAADLYALGCTLYYALVGHMPFGGETIDQVQEAHRRHLVVRLEHRRPDLPIALCQWVHWLMDRAVARRPLSAAAALASLEATMPTTQLTPSVPVQKMAPRFATVDASDSTGFVALPPHAAEVDSPFSLISGPQPAFAANGRFGFEMPAQPAPAPSKGWGRW
jgi:serine/threonine protein kinase